MIRITLNLDGIQIRIKGESEQSSHQDLYTRAVSSLIYEADIHGWEKQDRSQDVKSDALSDFCAAVLVAVTRLWADEAELPDEQADVAALGKINLPLSKPVHKILNDLIRDLRQYGYLEDKITGSSRLRPVEPEDFN